MWNATLKDKLKSDSLLKLKNSESFLTTGCFHLDAFLRGGLIHKGITQIYGESGIGKTQLALQLCLSAQIPSINSKDIGGAAYICTEAPFPSNRLQELIKKSPIANKYSISDEMIFIEHISNTKDLENCISSSERLPLLLSKYKINVLIIDSIAATYRMEYDPTNLKQRAKSLRTLGYQLHRLANIYKTAIICINQVTAVIENSSIEYISSKEQPSLGITWASMNTNSFFLYRKHNQRFISTAGSPYLPYKIIEFEIVDSGIKAKNS